MEYVLVCASVCPLLASTVHSNGMFAVYHSGVQWYM